jgi:hypothetical protein
MVSVSAIWMGISAHHTLISSRITLRGRFITPIPCRREPEQAVVSGSSIISLSRLSSAWGPFDDTAQREDVTHG